MGFWIPSCLGVFPSSFTFIACLASRATRSSRITVTHVSVTISGSMTPAMARDGAAAVATRKYESNFLSKFLIFEFWYFRRLGNMIQIFDIMYKILISSIVHLISNLNFAYDIRWSIIDSMLTLNWFHSIFYDCACDVTSFGTFQGYQEGFKP